MTSYIVYNVRCITEHIDKQWILPETEPVPTTCPTDTNHTIDPSLTAIQRTVDGYEPDEASYPGRKAVGSIIETLPPLINRVTIVLDVTTKNGVNLSEITNELKSSVINYINTFRFI